MSNINVTLDLSSLSQYFENFAKQLTKDVKSGVKGLAQSTQSHIKEKAQNNLHSFREQYLKSLSPPQQIDDFVWEIVLDAKAEWIETGRPEPYDMKIGLLKDAKISKDGSKYRVVPMNQAKSPSELSSGNAGYEQNMINKVKSELKKRGIPYKKLEIDPKTGSPRIGKLHSLNIESEIPGKQWATHQLKGLSIYQTKQKDGSVKRSITTFRTVTDKENQKNKWWHPSVEGKNFFEEARTWSESEWEHNWLPKIMEKYR